MVCQMFLHERQLISQAIYGRQYILGSIAFLGIQRCRWDRICSARLWFLSLKLMVTFRIRPCLLCNDITANWIEGDFVLAQQLLVVADTVEEFALRESASFPTSSKCGWHTLCLRFDAVCARKFSITFHFSLLTKDACEHSLWLQWEGGLRGRIGRHGGLPAYEFHSIVAWLFM